MMPDSALSAWGDSLNLEAILAAQPDLIIASTAITQEDYDNLSKIAPTIVYYREDWRSSLTALGEAFGMEEEAQAVVSEYENKIAMGRTALNPILTEGKSLQADYLFITLGGAGGTNEEIAQLKENFKNTVEQSAVWRSVPAVKAGHVIYVNARHWISTGPIANSMKIDDVIAALGASN